jgi:cell division septation protein DedD
MQPAVQVLEQFGVAVEVRVLSAHRTPLEMVDFAQMARERGFKVIINETTSGARRLLRVRVGPVADRAAAVALEAQLRSLAPDRAIVAVPATG